MPRRTKKNVSVLTADIVHSTHYSLSQRHQINQALLKSFKEIEERFPKAIYTPLAFRITAGDEFQCVFREVSQTFDILTYLRASVATSKIRPIIMFRTSIGVGKISVSGKSNPYEQDGPAFVRSRRGLEELYKTRQRLTRIVIDDLERARTMNVILLLLDRLQKNWTVPQWQAIKWSILGLTREEIAKKLHVAHQNVTKRLLAAGWQEFRLASELLREMLAKSALS